MPHRSLSNRIALWFGGTLSAVLACIMLVLHVRIEAETGNQVDRETRNAQRVLHQLLQARADTLAARARSLGSLPNVGALLDVQDPSTTQDVAREYPRLFNLSRDDFLMLTNADGRVLAHTRNPARIWANASGHSGVARALRGQVRVELWKEGNRIHQVASAPAYAGGVLTGTVHLGFALDDAFARQLQAASGTHLTVLAGDHICASSLDGVAKSELLGLLKEGLAGPNDGRIGRALPRRHLLEGHQVLTLVSPIRAASGQPLGAFLIQKSLDDALMPYRNIQRWLLVIGLAGLLVGLLVSFRVASGITEPILRVVAAAAALGEGNWSQRLPTNARDELGVLARAFNAMAMRLQGWDADLRAAVAERTAELNQAVIRLDTAFEKMRRFNADASHELRTPLTIMRGEAEVALRSPRSAREYEHSLRSILEETEHMGRIIEQLLTLARADSGELKLEMAPVAVHDLLADLYPQGLVLGRSKGIDLAVSCPARLQTVGDELRLHQLFLNLLDNAIKYTAPGGRVWLEAWEEEGRPVVQVRDTGIGIAPEHLPSLFDRFFRVDKARSREVGGSGLGLSICQWIVDAHGATIAVESEPGAGTTFRVRLRRGPTENAPLPRPADRAPVAAANEAR